MPVDISSRATLGELMSDKKAYVFPLSSSTLLKLSKGTITTWSINGRSDAIVNSTNEQMRPGGGADLAIHSAAGPQLQDMCCNFPEILPGVHCPTGEARITPGFELPASRVIHTVGPIYFGDRNPAASMKNAYSLALAKENKIQCIAFSAICCGDYGYPLQEAAAVAISTVKKYADDFKEVHFVLLLEEVFNVWLEKAYELLSN